MNLSVSRELLVISSIFGNIGLDMNWNHPSHVEVHYYNNTTYPYNSAGSFMEYFEGLTYEHVNFIFDGASHLQESVYPSMNTNFYKFGLSESGSTSYYDYGGHPYEVGYHEPRIEEERRPSNNSSTVNNVQTASVNTVRERNTNTNSRPRRHHNAPDHQVVWQDNVDPDNMTYEELLELGETVGTQSRGLSQELIASLPISKFKCGFFGRKKSRHERCVICQMEYKRGDRCITLPCKHAYHAGCGARWLSINKACPICYTEVFGETSKR